MSFTIKRLDNKCYTVQKIKLYCDYGTLVVCRFHFVFKFYEVASYQNVVILAVIREAVYHFLSTQSNLNDSAVEIVHIVSIPSISLGYDL